MTLSSRTTLLFVCLLFLGVTGGRLLCQTPGDPTGGTPGRIPSIRPILVDLEFEGNTAIGEAQLLAAITSRASRPGLPRSFDVLLAGLIEANPLADSLEQALAQRYIDSTINGEYRYLNLKNLALDTARIVELYTSYGYHDAHVVWRITLDTVRNTSILRFIIAEGIRYPLAGIRYVYSGGVEPPDSVRNLYRQPEAMSLGDPYSQDKLYAEINRVVALLRNNGYPFAAMSGAPTVFHLRPPRVSEPQDTALVTIYTGGRYRFGETVYRPDTSYAGRPVDPDLVLDQREYEPGEWYSFDKINLTTTNLYELGTFDLVGIDTTRASLAEGKVGMLISARLRAQNDFRAAPEISLERRIQEFVYNIGLSSSYSRINLLGGAERFTVNGRVQIPLLRREELQYSASVAYFKPSNPYAWIIGSKRLSFRASADGEYTVLGVIRGDGSDIPDEYLRTTGFKLGSEFTLRLPTYTLFNRLLVSGSVQWNKYHNVRRYIERIVDTLNKNPNEPASRRVVMNWLTENIYRIPILQGDDPTLLGENDTAAYKSFNSIKQTYSFGVALLGDTRNNAFAPTRGYFAEMRGELGLSGLLGFSGFPVGRWNGGYGKIDFGYRSFSEVINNWTLGARFHAGFISEFGPLPLTPISSRFSAGGANSIRGWATRDMIATRRTANVSSADSLLLKDSDIAGLIDANRRLLGGLGVLELSLELRRQIFSFPSGSSAAFLNDLIWIPFIDAGNAFFRDREDIGLVPFFSNIAIAAGMSLGYNTPVGPFRVGFGLPVYDPVDLTLQTSAERWIFNRKVANLFVIHLGIGHAF